MYIHCNQLEERVIHRYHFDDIMGGKIAISE